MEKSFIGVVAKQSSVPIKTIRYYEEEGLLPKPSRTASGYRLYDPDAVNRLQFIKQAQGLGLRLDEIRDILDLADRGRCPCGHVQNLLEARLQELRQRIISLRELERRLVQVRRRSCPPSFRPRGKAICPTIQGDGLTIRKGGKKR